MKKLLFILPLFIVFSGESCAQVDTNLLNYKDSTFFKERSIILTNKQLTQGKFTLYEEIAYNDPHYIDEEFSYTLMLRFENVKAAKTKKVLNLSIDTAIIKTDYGIFSVWNWSDEKSEVSGEIEILNWTKKEVTIRENVLVYDKRRNQKRVFKGTRTFTEQKGW